MYVSSGCGYNSLNGEGWNTPANRNLTLAAVEVLASRYSSYPNVIGQFLLFILHQYIFVRFN